MRPLAPEGTDALLSLQWFSSNASPSRKAPEAAAFCALEERHAAGTAPVPRATVFSSEGGGEAGEAAGAEEGRPPGAGGGWLAHASAAALAGCSRLHQERCHLLCVLLHVARPAQAPAALHQRAGPIPLPQEYAPG